MLVAIASGSAIAALQIGHGYWKDEAIAVTIAVLPWEDIPDTLRFDASPPLYYLLLHVWMRVFGTSEIATGALSLLFAAATLIAMFLTGRRFAGDETGSLAVAWLAISVPGFTWPLTPGCTPS